MYGPASVGIPADLEDRLDRKALTVAVAATLTTLAEESPAPKSPFYIALGMDGPLWQAVEGVLVKAGWATSNATTISITDSGRKVASQINAAVR